VIYAEPAFLSLAEGCGWTTWDDRDMFPTLCCGLAGRAYGLLNLYRHTGDGEWLERARVLGQRAARAAEHPRARFDFPLSLYKGTPGIVLLQTDLEHPEASCMPCFEPEGWPSPGPA
jgi:serine/threonine-protein kinase